MTSSAPRGAAVGVAGREDGGREPEPNRVARRCRGALACVVVATFVARASPSPSAPEPASASARLRRGARGARRRPVVVTGRGVGVLAGREVSGAGRRRRGPGRPAASPRRGGGDEATAGASGVGTACAGFDERFAV